MATTGAFSDYAEDLIAKWLFKNTAPSAPANLYVAAMTVMPADDGTGGTEVSTSGTAYARIAVSCGTAGTGAGSGWTETTPGTVVSNTADLLYAVCTASWGTVVGFCIYDASSGGNMISRHALASGVAITSVGVDQLKIQAGQLTLTID